jgi:DNA adenine methylase
MRPFLKWAGGKYRLVERIKKELPPGKRLIEPFAGSCALALNTDFRQYRLNDINPDLIGLYRILQQEGPSFIDFCEELYRPANNDRDRYYKLRDEFNRSREPRRRTALFLYLNRHGYNGLCRYNAKGGFNVPFGRYKRPYFPWAEMLFFHEKFQKTEFTTLDFEAVIRAAEYGDVIYCDPPYVPLNQTANFTAYSAGGFGPAEQERLAQAAEETAARGIPVIISNHYHESVMEAYCNARIEIINVRRVISCKCANRDLVKEVIAVFGS